MPKTAARAALLGLFVITAAVACGGTHPTTGAAAGSATAAATHSATAAPLSCKQQYKAWKNGAAKPVGNKLKTELTAIQTAGANEDIPALLAALKAVGKTAARLEQYPAPACADPHGYWKKILARIQAAGDNAGADTGLTGLILAEAPLKGRPGAGEKAGRGTQAHYLTASGTHSTGKRRQVGASPALPAFLDPGWYRLRVGPGQPAQPRGRPGQRLIQFFGDCQAVTKVLHLWRGHYPDATARSRCRSHRNGGVRGGLRERHLGAREALSRDGS